MYRDVERRGTECVVTHTCEDACCRASYRERVRERESESESERERERERERRRRDERRVCSDAS